MRETKSARLTRMHDEYDILRQVIPAPACALHFSNPLELLIATVLSAQTTDKRVNTVTPELFATYPTARDLAAANPAQVEDIIHPLGFYRS
ncbi:endonuclease III domain-containing protein, partial [Bifidobacterium longum]